jgi:hypothetical protein
VRVSQLRRRERGRARAMVCGQRNRGTREGARVSRRDDVEANGARREA